MDTRILQRELISLEPGTPLRLFDSVGRGVAILSGKVWITQEGDPRDLFLGGGESFVLDRPGLALVQGVSASTLALFELEPGDRPKRPQDVTVHAGAA